MDPAVAVSRIADRAYRVEHDGRNETVYIAGPQADRWIFWNGRIYHGDFRGGVSPRAGRPRPALAQSLTAPMPARVSRIAVRPAAAVKKGDTLIVLEAMKMELPIRAPADAIVKAVHCREGELVQAGEVLIDL